MLARTSLGSVTSAYLPIYCIALHYYKPAYSIALRATKAILKRFLKAASTAVYLAWSPLVGAGQGQVTMSVSGKRSFLIAADKLQIGTDYSGCLISRRFAVSNSDSDLALLLSFL